MKVITKYVAEDGTEFENEQDCFNYENERCLTNIKNEIVVLNGNYNHYKNWWDYDSTQFYGLRFATHNAYCIFRNVYETECMPWNCHVDYDQQPELVGTTWIFSTDDDKWHCLEADIAQAQKNYENLIENFKE